MVNQLFAKRVLEKAGHEAILAESGQAALSRLENDSFDVVLMDVQMPIMDGYQTTVRIREGEQGTDRHQPVIAMTAHAMKGDREHCLEKGMDDYVSKPIQSHLLFQAIASVLEPRKRADKIAPEGSAPHGVEKTIFKEVAMPLDPKFLKELAVMFLEDCPLLMTNIRDAIDGREASNLKLAAHTLKGSAGVFKDQPAFDTAFHMEHIGRDADWNNAETAWNMLTTEMDRLSEALKELLVPEELDTVEHSTS